jgi:hypothetical protein
MINQLKGNCKQKSQKSTPNTQKLKSQKSTPNTQKLKSQKSTPNAQRPTPKIFIAISPRKEL